MASVSRYHIKHMSAMSLIVSSCVCQCAHGGDAVLEGSPGQVREVWQGRDGNNEQLWRDCKLTFGCFFPVLAETALGRKGNSSSKEAAAEEGS